MYKNVHNEIYLSILLKYVFLCFNIIHPMLHFVYLTEQTLNDGLISRTKSLYKQNTKYAVGFYKSFNLCSKFLCLILKLWYIYCVTFLKCTLVVLSFKPFAAILNFNAVLNNKTEINGGFNSKSIRNCVILFTFWD